jgi:hypothetical protein
VKAGVNILTAEKTGFRWHSWITCRWKWGRAEGRFQMPSARSRKRSS